MTAKALPTVIARQTHDVKMGDRLVYQDEGFEVVAVEGRTLTLTSLPATAPVRFTVQHRVWHASPGQVIAALERQW